MSIKHTMISRESYKFAKWFYDRYRTNPAFGPIALDFEDNIFAESVDERFTVEKVYLAGSTDNKIGESLKNIYSDSTTLIRSIKYLIDEGLFEGYIQQHSEGFTFRELNITSTGVRLIEGAENDDSLNQIRQESGKVFNISFNLIKADNLGVVNAMNNTKIGANGLWGWIKSKIFKK